MKQVNFKELNVEVDIDSFQKRDVRNLVGNSLHRQAETVPISELAKKIYYSDGIVEISDEDYDVMIPFLRLSIKKFIVDSIVKAAEESENKEE
ncbi:hypothetical protein DW083_16505 [Parabacteroides sp. AF48-14]|jgi:hypothetical protein|uniref:hypothetical protein n=1 Tax=Parabacteroides sp. AF48-14 TaxID=2292052 RepID=UPI000EFF2A16|nr:hypothetical protein [Parabacteroides sp. AF48-14]RHO68262.1 hypothetical protein DW083_16505 [Parabacteroides sp. AF48-14]